MKCIPHLNLILYSKTGVCRGIPNFLIFDPKHTTWVLVRTASAMYVLSENIEKKDQIILFSPMKFSFCLLKKISVYSIGKFS